MKIIFHLFLFFIFGCTNQQKESSKNTAIDSLNLKVSLKNTEKFYEYATSDSLTIITDLGDTLIYGKEEINKIIDKNPELVSENTQNPDQVYYCNGEMNGFNSEVGQDGYYVLYAYFLKKKNGDKKYAERRKKLIDLFQNINALFQKFEHGGTYFGHQYVRIVAYAEYSVYLFKQNEVYGNSKTYDISKQKKLYIKSLRQLVIDEIKIDNYSLGQDKIERTIELNKIVDAIDLSISDNYYLRRTQEFHYGHYEYY